MALPAVISDVQAHPAGGTHLRRCTFRRLTQVQAGALPLYEAECLYPSRQVAIPLGDLDTARPICNACQATGVFRPDED